ncbi:hypothetical protein FLJC2902T_16930 [Flavobacterium limnosediminis JC2902]|uniref:Uncharacterized protein n=1 Tax=Flavobacterium limnosediminis JC2902 TaxID=1341181 RepID=V6SQ52_9FLAO|nr:hypothetical protein FLJC2902T_16930 [Flavobacterium limnosediminis JC2902]
MIKQNLNSCHQMHKFPPIDLCQFVVKKQSLKKLKQDTKIVGIPTEPR